MVMHLGPLDVASH